MKKIIMIFAVLAISMMFANDLCLSTGDNSDRLSSNQSGVFSPGYINSTMQKTREIINQAESRKSPIEVRSDAVKDDISNKVVEDNTDKPKLELKKKTGGGGDASNVAKSASSEKVPVRPD
jgi:hypothetical protein